LAQGPKGGGFWGGFDGGKGLKKGRMGRPHWPPRGERKTPYPLMGGGGKKTFWGEKKGGPSWLQ